MSDDVKKAGVRPVVHPDLDAIQPRDRDAPATGEAAADTYVQAEPKAESAAAPSNPLFRQEDVEVFLEAKALIERMKDLDRDVRRKAIIAYEKLSNEFTEGSPEVYRGAKTLRMLMEDPDDDVRYAAVDAYGSLSANFAEGSTEVYDEALVLRELMKNSEDSVCHAAASAYGHLSMQFASGAPEVQIGAQTLRGLMFQREGGAKWAAYSSYAILTAKFVEGSPEVYSEIMHLLPLMKLPNHAECWNVFAACCGLIERIAPGAWELNVAANLILESYIGIRFDVRSELIERFHRFSRVGFFKAGFESGGWMGGLVFSGKAVRNLRGFAGQPGFIGFRDSVMLVLDSLSRLTRDKRVVLNSVFEATDPTKWKSVRNTLRTLRALAALDFLPDNVGREFYASHRGFSGDTRARLRADVEKTLMTFLCERIGDSGEVALLLKDEVPKDVQAVRKYLSKKGLLTLFAQSASFMDGEGIGILRKLFEDLVESPFVDGELRYQKRYDRMVEKLGFSPDFVEGWSKEWSRAHESLEGAVDEGEVKKLVMDQAAAQLAVHVNSTEGVDGEFKELPDRLRTLIDSLGRQEADEKEIGKLHEIMEVNYGKVREAYGDLFANARVDLKNLVTGLTKGVKVAKNAVLTEITGLVEKMAFHGTIPTETCQRLSSLYAESTNGKGQPLNKLLWGQFKLANYVMDGEVVARRMLEVTRDEEGREHLLAERAYTAGGFAGLADFDEDIVEHARGLGIDRDRVHFLDRHERRQIPLPLATGALMYRDSGLGEVNPAMMKPFQMLPVTAMPMMSARMMLRTGT